MKRPTDISEIRKVKDKAYGDPGKSGEHLGQVIFLALKTWWRRHKDIPAHVYWLLRAIEKIFRALYTDDEDTLRDSYLDARNYVRIAQETDGRIDHG